MPRGIPLSFQRPAASVFAGPGEPDRALSPPGTLCEDVPPIPFSPQPFHDASTGCGGETPQASAPFYPGHPNYLSCQNPSWQDQDTILFNEDEWAHVNSLPPAQPPADPIPHVDSADYTAWAYDVGTIDSSIPWCSSPTNFFLPKQPPAEPPTTGDKSRWANGPLEVGNLPWILEHVTVPPSSLLHSQLSGGVWRPLPAMCGARPRPRSLDLPSTGSCHGTRQPYESLPSFYGYAPYTMDLSSQSQEAIVPSVNCVLSYQELTQQRYQERKSSRKFSGVPSQVIRFGPHGYPVSSARKGKNLVGLPNANLRAFPDVEVGQKLSWRFLFEDYTEFDQQFNVLDAAKNQPTIGRIMVETVKALERFKGDEKRFAYQLDQLFILELELVSRASVQAKIGVLEDDGATHQG
ncbi:hypothetical protein V8D89_002614 [Ganoderma adspersum]